MAGSRQRCCLRRSHRPLPPRRSPPAPLQLSSSMADDQRPAPELHSVLAAFPPVAHAVAYGSGVFAQPGLYEDGGDSGAGGTGRRSAPAAPQTGDRPMLDFIFAVEDPVAWHAEVRGSALLAGVGAAQHLASDVRQQHGRSAARSTLEASQPPLAQNLRRHASHYSLLRALGPAGMTAVAERLGAGVYFNTLVPWGPHQVCLPASRGSVWHCSRGRVSAGTAQRPAERPALRLKLPALHMHTLPPCCPAHQVWRGAAVGAAAGPAPLEHALLRRPPAQACGHASKPPRGGGGASRQPGGGAALRAAAAAAALQHAGALCWGSGGGGVEGNRGSSQSSSSSCTLTPA